MIQKTQFVSLFPFSVSFVSLWALGFPTTYDLSVFSPYLCLLYHCEHLAFLLPMICQSFPLLCVFCIIVSTWLSYYLWFVSLFPSVSFVSLWALGFPTTYDLSVFSPSLCLLYHCEHLTLLLHMKRGKDWQIIGSRKVKCSQWYKRHRGGENTDKS